MKQPVTGNLLKASVLLMALQEAGAGAATPALGAIAAAFPDVSPTVIQNISTLPALTTVLFGFAYAFLVKLMRKRSILYLAVAFFLIGGIVPAFLNNIYVILILRGFVGAAVGLLYPMANDLIVDFWEGDERKKLIGWAFSVCMAGGVIFQSLGGALSDINWHYTFYAYGVGIIFFIIPLLFLPEPPKKEDVVKGTKQEKAGVPARVYVLCILNSLWAIFFTVVVSNGAMIISSEGIGTGAQIGMVFSVMTVGGFLGGFFFGKINKILKHFSLLFSYWVIALGMVVFYLSHTISMMFVAMMIVGIALGYTGSNFFNKSTDIVPFVVSTLALSLITTFNGLGQFLSPFVMNPLVAAFGQSPGRFSILAGAVILFILGIFAFFFDRATPKIPESEKPHVLA